MNVLLTHLHLDYPGGSETCTYTLARTLLERGHRPTVVSPIVGEVGERIRAAHVPVVDELSKVQGHPHVLHCQHNVMALAARAWFPGARSSITRTARSRCPSNRPRWTSTSRGTWR